MVRRSATWPASARQPSPFDASPAVDSPGVRLMLRRLLDENVRLTRELRELRRLRDLVHRDELTGLPNRRLWTERFTEELSRSRRAAGRPGSLLIVDVDDLSGLAERLGHAAVDLALREVARVLRGALRAADVCCRTGGHEFSILLPDTDAARARLVMARLKAAVMRAGARQEVPLSVSVGPASWPQDGDDPAALRAIADRARCTEKQRLERRSVDRGPVCRPALLALVK